MSMRLNCFQLLLMTIVVKIINMKVLLEQEVAPESLCSQLFLNCSATNLPGSALQWFFGGSVVTLYTYRHDHQYPFNVEPNHTWNYLVVQVLSASLSEDNHDYSNFESTLMANISTLREHGVQNITCGSFGTRSNVFSPNLNETAPPPPPPPPSTSCSLFSSPGGSKVTLQWSPSFTSQHAVERYHVAVNPDPSSCSSDQVSPSEDYSCSGLSLGTNYSITVSAIRCGDQEGTRDTFTVLPQVANRALLIAGVIVELAALSCCMITAVFGVLKYHNQDQRITKSRKNFITILVFFLTSTILVLVSLLLWIITGAVIEQQANTCDSTWLSGVDALIVSAFLVSLIAFLSVMGTLISIMPFLKIITHKISKITAGRESCSNVTPTSDSVETSCAKITIKNCREKQLEPFLIMEEKF